MNVCTGQGVVRRLKKDHNPQRDHSSLRDNYLVEHRLQTKKKKHTGIRRGTEIFIHRSSCCFRPHDESCRSQSAANPTFCSHRDRRMDDWKAFIANWSVLLSMVPSTAGVNWELTWDPQQSLQKQGTQPIIYPNNPSSSSVCCKPLPLHRRHCFSHNIPPLRRLSLPNTQAAILLRRLNQPPGGELTCDAYFNI